MDILIVGGGSVGLGLASCLIKSGHNVSILARSATVSALKEHGLSRSGIFGSWHAEPASFGAYSSLEQLQQPFEYVLICTKAYDTEQVAQQFAQSTNPATALCTFVLCQNGYGNFEHFTHYFPSQRVYLARIITGFRRHGPHEVSITVHADAIRLGHPVAALSERMVALARAIEQGDIPAQVSPEIVKDIWSKILYNALLNPLGALFAVPYERLAASSDACQIMNSLAQEAFAVLHKAGLQTHWNEASVFLREFYESMLPATAAHESSMLQDIQAGRKTEIDAINGAIVALGHHHGVAVQTHECITRMVKFLEQR